MSEEVQTIDLDVIEADLKMVEATLAGLAAGTYFAPATDVDPADVSAD